jgi:alkylated DNA repair dioxygenase AlkB
LQYKDKRKGKSEKGKETEKEKGERREGQTRPPRHGLMDSVESNAATRVPAPISQEALFASEFLGPPGFVYQPGFITRAEESALLGIIRELPLQEAKFQQYTARRRTVWYGTEYDRRRKTPNKAAGIPEFLLPLRDKIAGWIGLPAQDFVHGLVTEYRPGTPLGWHRDAPEYEAVAGVSLGGAARMRLRPYQPGAQHRKEDVISLELEPRSAYQMRDQARWGWQHSIAATKQLRYSITFRSNRRR